jgi:type IV pilus assembly protein PilX
MINQPIFLFDPPQVTVDKHFSNYNSLIHRFALDQSGAVLIISLIILLLLTIIVGTAIQTTSLEEKMAGNLRDRNIAFQAAESALRAGEAFLTQATLPSFTSTGTGGLYNEIAITPQQNDDWSTFNTITYSTASLSHTVSPPLYVIQRLSNIGSSSLDAGSYNENELYRVIAKGLGSTSNTVVVLQATYKR